MGRFELEPFAPGTHVLADELAAAGGGETVAALRRHGLEDSVTHTLIGGGATRELFENRRLPGMLTARAATTPGP